MQDEPLEECQWCPSPIWDHDAYTGIYFCETIDQTHAVKPIHPTLFSGVFLIPATLKMFWVKQVPSMIDTQDTHDISFKSTSVHKKCKYKEQIM